MISTAARVTAANLTTAALPVEYTKVTTAMEPLSHGASLPGIQDYVARMETERGLDKQDLPSQCLKLGEEVGELYRAIREPQGQPQDPGGRIADVGDEAVDELILLMSIVNRCGINPEDSPQTALGSRSWPDTPKISARTSSALVKGPQNDDVSTSDLNARPLGSQACSYTVLACASVLLRCPTQPHLPGFGRSPG